MSNLCSLGDQQSRHARASFFMSSRACASSSFLSVAGFASVPGGAGSTTPPPALRLWLLSSAFLGPPSFYTSSPCIILVCYDFWTDWVCCAVAGNPNCTVEGEVQRPGGQARHTGGGPMHSFTHHHTHSEAVCTLTCVWWFTATGPSSTALDPTFGSHNSSFYPFQGFHLHLTFPPQSATVGVVYDDFDNRLLAQVYV